MRTAILVFALLLPGLASAQRALPADAPEQAVRRYKLGIELYRAKKYEAAAREFRVASKLYPTSPKLAYNLARCLERSSRYGEAVAAYERYLEIAPEADDRVQVEGFIAALLEELPELVLSSEPPGAEVQVDGNPVEGQTPLRVRIPPGAHLVRVALGPRATTKTIEITAGQNALFVELPGVEPEPAPTVVEEVEPAAEPGGIWPWATLGVGAVGLATRVAFTFVAVDEAEQRDAIGADTPEAREHHDAMNSANTVSLIGYGVGGLGVAAGVWLLFLDDPEATTQIAPGPGFVTVRGRF